MSREKSVGAARSYNRGPEKIGVPYKRFKDSLRDRWSRV